jgi:hypothetical protein
MPPCQQKKILLNNFCTKTDELNSVTKRFNSPDPAPITDNVYEQKLHEAQTAWEQLKKHCEECSC